MTGRILFIEDDTSGREIGIFNLQKAGYTADGAKDGFAGLKLFDKNGYDIVVTDVKMPGMSGIELLEKIQILNPDVPVIIITAFADIEMAVSAMKAGAFDFIGKPFSRDHLLLTIKRAMESTVIKRELKLLRIAAKGIERPIIFKSPVMENLLKFTDKIAASDTPVLITGQSGTGKELIARRIHAGSKRAEGPFIALNAAAISANLIESELFGHVEGAFTGASKSREGLFKSADNGTLFLDEISQMPLPLQSKLLRVLQEGTVQSVGKDKPVTVNVRIVAATNRNILADINEGLFREDLYYRINVMNIDIPPLKDRKEDLLPLVQFFLEKYSEGRQLELSSDAVLKLTSWTWPGNIRELENICRRMAILTEGHIIDTDTLPPEINNFQNSDLSIVPSEQTLFELPEKELSLIDLEKRVIIAVLKKLDGNVSKAAVYLKIPRHQLAYRMHKYGIVK